jgi:hypothetical protein
MAVFWVVAPCSLVEAYQSFGGPCCLHYQGESQKTAIFECFADQARRNAYGISGNVRAVQ